VPRLACFDQQRVSRARMGLHFDDARLGVSVEDSSGRGGRIVGLSNDATVEVRWRDNRTNEVIDLAEITAVLPPGWTAQPEADESAVPAQPNKRQKVQHQPQLQNIQPAASAAGAAAAAASVEDHDVLSPSLSLSSPSPAVQPEADESAVPAQPNKRQKVQPQPQLQNVQPAALAAGAAAAAVAASVEDHDVLSPSLSLSSPSPAVSAEDSEGEHGLRGLARSYAKRPTSTTIG
jgi:hypothetical protein